VSEQKDGPEDLEVEANDEVAGDRVKAELPYKVIPEAPWSRKLKWTAIVVLTLLASWGMIFVYLELEGINTMPSCEQPSALIQLIQGVPFFVGLTAAGLSFVGHLFSFLAPYLAGATSAWPLLRGETKPARISRVAHLSSPTMIPDKRGESRRQTVDRLGTVFRFAGAGVAFATAIIAWMLLDSLSLLNGTGVCM
jgi:hypothetical protein